MAWLATRDAPEEPPVRGSNRVRPGLGPSLLLAVGSPTHDEILVDEQVRLVKKLAYFLALLPLRGRTVRVCLGSPGNVLGGELEERGRQVPGSAFERTDLAGGNVAVPEALYASLRLR